MQEKIDEEFKTVKPQSTDGKNFDWNHYFHLDTINSWLDFLCSQYTFITPIELGKSYEGQTIKGVKLSRQQGNPTIFVEGGIHAREWISPATATFILNQLLVSDDSAVKDLSTNFNWIFFPTVNPDGYRYTFEQDRLWRKSRQPHGIYRGADLNRNFNIDWNGSGASSDTASYDYAGSAPFSEPEAQAISEFISKNRQTENICIYIALHSYSQLVMFPLGHTPEPIAGYKQHKLITEKACQSIKSVHGKEYKCGSKYETIYPSSGGSIDWAYVVGQIPISITFELRGPPESSDMFILPADQIIPTGEETLAAFVSIAQEARQLGFCKCLI